MLYMESFVVNLLWKEIICCAAGLEKKFMYGQVIGQSGLTSVKKSLNLKLFMSNRVSFFVVILLWNQKFNTLKFGKNSI